MTHALTLSLGDAADLAWAQRTVTERHYLRAPVDPRARPMVYVIRRDDWRVGLVVLGIPHATRCTGWWGYPDLPTQWQVVDLSRIWIDPDLQAGGFWCEPGSVPGYTDRHGVFRPTVATWAISEVLGRVQAEAALVAGGWGPGDDIRWSRQCAVANARYAAERAQYEARAAWEADRDAAIAAVIARNIAMARHGGNSMVFDGIPEKYKVQP